MHPTQLFSFITPCSFGLTLVYSMNGKRWQLFLSYGPISSCSVRKKKRKRNNVSYSWENLSSTQVNQQHERVSDSGPGWQRKTRNTTPSRDQRRKSYTMTMTDGMAVAHVTIWNFPNKHSQNWGWREREHCDEWSERVSLSEWEYERVHGG